MNGMRWVMVAVAILLAGFPARGAETVSLAGEWRFVHDPGNQSDPQANFSGRATLPGTPDESGHGTPNPKGGTDGWTRRLLLEGTCWFQRDVTVPAKWADKRITLSLERTKITQLWVDGKRIGSQDGVCVPQVYDLSAVLTPGAHVLTVAVTTGPFPKGVGGHHLGGLQGKWNGIIGRIELSARDPVWIESVLVMPDITKKVATLKIVIGNRTERPVKGELQVSANLSNSTKRHVPADLRLPFQVEGPTTTVTADYPLGDGAVMWSEFEPALYETTVRLTVGGERKFADERVVNFGLREFLRRRTQFTVNGKVTMLRGTHDACSFPLTGYPAMEAGDWMRIFQVAKSHGLNHYRFHTWCPPRAAFEAADLVGIYLQPELPSHSGYVFGSDKDSDGFLRREGERILEAFGNHPSFVMFALGNENFTPNPANRTAMNDLLAHFREIDSSRRYAGSSNPNFTNPELNRVDDYWTTFRTRKGGDGAVRGSFAPVDAPQGFVQDGPPSMTYDYRKALADVPVPVIGHEVGQYTVFPDFHEIEKYRGTLRAANYEELRDRLARTGMLTQADDFVRASGALAAICYRAEIEAALRTTGFGGFQLLDMIDNQEQGTSPVGILNAFHESKGLIRPEEWREFCSGVVPLVRLPRFTWTDNDMIIAPVEVANYGTDLLRNAETRWELLDADGGEIANGRFITNIVQGAVTRVGEIRLGTWVPRAPQRLTLEVRVRGTRYANRYPLWIYSSKLNTNAPSSLVVSRHLDAATLRELADGRRVVLFPELKDIEAHSVPGTFPTAFWNCQMFKQPGTMGILCNPEHAALTAFPTSFHSDWQWWQIATRARPIILEGPHATHRPIVQVIDNPQRNHKLALIFEARVGRGRLLVCASDLPGLAAREPEARQLMVSLFRYAASDKFQPTSGFTAEELIALLSPPKE